MGHISFIYFRYNTHPDECVCVGMILIDPAGNCKAKLSDSKMKLARKILPNKNIFKMFKMSVTQLVDYDKLTVDYVDRLHRYQNGLIKIDKPSAIAITSLDDFDILFEKSIEECINR